MKVIAEKLTNIWITHPRQVHKQEGDLVNFLLREIQCLKSSKSYKAIKYYLLNYQEMSVIFKAYWAPCLRRN